MLKFQDSSVHFCGIYSNTSLNCNNFLIVFEIMYTVCLPSAASCLDSNTACTRNTKWFDLEVNALSESYNTERCDK